MEGWVSPRDAETSLGHLFCRFFIGDGKTRLILKGR